MKGESGRSTLLSSAMSFPFRYLWGLDTHFWSLVITMTPIERRFFTIRAPMPRLL
jgi:hypothetical protein